MDKKWETMLSLVDARRDLVYTAAKTIWAKPEIGYKEWATSRYLEKEFEALGYQLRRAETIPGFTAELDTGVPGPTVAVLGELDSLICDTHPEADPETKAVHACGHNCQAAYLLGLAAALRGPGALDGLCGRVRFVAVPAEETIDLEFRNRLIADNVIKYVAGKVEFLYRGLLDGVDMALMMHADTGGPHLFEIFDGADGCITKHFEFEGTAAHAGAAPHNGVNALYAAAIGLQACNALRETFRESDYVRFHPIITKAGVAANAIPDRAKLDAYVRAGTVEAMLATNARINRALAASAASLGANLHIVDKPGNMPLGNNRDLNELVAEIATGAFGPESVRRGPWQTISCDMGDLSVVMPAIQPMVTGASGTVHGRDFQMGDMERSCLNPTRMLGLMVYELLRDGGARAEEIKRRYQPVYPDKTAYFAAIDAIALDERVVEYRDDGGVVLHVGRRA